jgi:beta-xylosidase
LEKDDDLTANFGVPYFQTTDSLLAHCRAGYGPQSDQLWDLYGANHETLAPAVARQKEARPFRCVFLYVYIYIIYIIIITTK